MKNKKRVKRIITWVLVAAVAGGAVFWFNRPKPEIVVYQRVSPLAVMDLRNTVDTTGSVSSLHSTTVNSAQSAEVNQIAVEVGDRVQAGQLLCVLDTADIELQITEMEARLATAARSNQMSVNKATTDLYYAEWYLENQQNASLLAAQQAVVDAQRAVEDAERAVQNARAGVRAARRDYEDAQDAEEDDETIATENAVRDTRDAVNQAVRAQETAEANLTAAREDVGIAQQKLNQTKWDTDRELAELRNAVTSAQNGADQTTDYIGLDRLREDLASCNITAPVSGTITAVYAKEGAKAEGLLFVIEDTESLVIETTIKELDINTVKPGMKVEIKSDATGDDVYEGELLSISPASLKDAQGNTITEGTAEYEAKVRVTTPTHGLRIGMNARVSIVTESADARMAVLYDAVTTDAEGNSIVYVAKPQEDGTYIATAVPVAVGMETNLYLEVSGEGLAEGDLILQDVGMLTDGAIVNIDPAMAGGFVAGTGEGGETAGGGGSGGVIVTETAIVG